VTGFDVEEIWKDLDEDGDDSISFIEFHQWMARLIDRRVVSQTAAHMVLVLDLLKAHYQLKPNTDQPADAKSGVGPERHFEPTVESHSAMRHRASSCIKASNVDSSRRLLLCHTSSYKAQTYTDSSGDNPRVSLEHRTTGHEILDVQSVTGLAYEASQRSEAAADWGARFSEYQTATCIERSDNHFEATEKAREIFQQAYWKPSAKKEAENAETGSVNFLLLCTSLLNSFAVLFCFLRCRNNSTFLRRSVPENLEKRSGPCVEAPIFVRT
jgi:hypothetical protein